MRALREPGECIMSNRSHDDGGWDLIIDRADPHVWICDQLLRALHDDDDDSPWVRLKVNASLVRDPRCDVEDCCAQRDVGTCFMGAILTIKAHNLTVIYKVGHWVPEANVWEARWPD